MASSNADWVVFLLVFNAGLIIFMGFHGATFNDNDYDTVERSNALIPNFEFDIISGFSNVPTWLNVIFVIQGIFTIYLLVVSITGG